MAGASTRSGGEVASRLRAGASSLGVELDDTQVEALRRFLDELELWNARTNLVGEHDWRSLVDRHLVDALAAVPVLGELGEELRVADIGSGAGLPGVPLAIAIRPRVMCLVEPRKKRASFLRSVRRALPEFGLAVLERRGEDVAASPESQGAFDAVVSRATMADEALRACAAPLLHEGGLLVAYRGPQDATTSLDGPLDGWDGPVVHGYDLGGAGRTFRLDVWTRRFT